MLCNKILTHFLDYLSWKWFFLLNKKKVARIRQLLNEFTYYFS